MVFQKKAASAVKNDQARKKGKKVEEEDDDLDLFEDMEDMDDSDDDDDESSGEDVPIQKTPQNKNPKGRQSLSEKKVSFTIPGRNTPAKTPNKDNSALIKKQLTPGSKSKTAVQEFKGMKGNQNNKSKKGADDDEDDDDDDDDDDEDDEDDDLDLQMDDDDDDDDDDEDDDDDDEDDDDDDEDEEEEKSGKGNVQKKAVAKQKDNTVQNKQKTPAKGADKAKSADTPKGAQSIKDEKTPKKSFIEAQNIERERRKQRDRKMLYVGGLPNDTKPMELKALSSDIEDCITPHSNRQHGNKVLFAFLEFASEKKAEENYKILQTKKFRGQLLNVDFVGEKSKNKKPSQTDEPKNFNMKKLYVTGIPVNATLDKVAKFFPKAYQICFNMSPEFRTATLNFINEADATEAFQANTDFSIDGHKLTVLHSIIGKPGKKNKRKYPHKKNMNYGKNPAKKMKRENE